MTVAGRIGAEVTTAADGCTMPTLMDRTGGTNASCGLLTGRQQRTKCARYSVTHGSTGEIMATEYATYMTLLDQCQRAERQVDWSMAQLIDDQIDAVALGQNHADINRRMYDRGVNENVRRRVLAGQAAHRARQWRTIL